MSHCEVEMAGKSLVQRKGLFLLFPYILFEMLLTNADAAFL